MNNDDTHDVSDEISKMRQDIVALRMIVQTMMVFMTEGKEGRGYDLPMLKLMQKSLLDIITDDPPEGFDPGAYKSWQDGIRRSINDLLNPLTGV